MDLGVFNACTTGFDILYDPNALPPGCTLAPDADGHIAAEFDTDGTITLVDYQQWLQQYRAAVGNPSAPAPLEVLGDFGRDGRVSEIDFQHFLACVTGPAIPQADSACQDADLDRDADVDQDDFGLLQRCYSGSAKINLSCKY